MSPPLSPGAALPWLFPLRARLNRRESAGPTAHALQRCIQRDPAAYPALLGRQGNLLPLPPPGVASLRLSARCRISDGRREAGTARPIGATCGRRRVQSAPLPGQAPPLVAIAGAGAPEAGASGTTGDGAWALKCAAASQTRSPTPTPLGRRSRSDGRPSWKSRERRRHGPFLSSTPLPRCGRVQATRRLGHKTPAGRAGGRRRAQGDPGLPTTTREGWTGPKSRRVPGEPARTRGYHSSCGVLRCGPAEGSRAMPGAFPLNATPDCRAQLATPRPVPPRPAPVLPAKTRLPHAPSPLTAPPAPPSCHAPSLARPRRQPPAWVSYKQMMPGAAALISQNPRPLADGRLRPPRCGTEHNHQQYVPFF